MIADCGLQFTDYGKKEELKKVPGSWFCVEKTKNEERRTKNNSGLTLIGIIAAIVIMGLLGAGVLMLVSTGSMESIQTLNWGQAFFAAESGVSAARAYMATNVAWYTNSSTITGTVGQASFSAILDKYGGITSVGSKDEAQWTSMWQPTWHAMLVYGTSTNAGTPKYRIWDGDDSLWSSPSNALNVGAANINWVVVKACPKRDEYIAVTLDTARAVKAQVYRNGIWTNLQTIATVPNAANRGVAIAYETLSGDAVVVAANDAPNVTCYVWDGDAWSAPVTINLPRGNKANWVKLASDPVSDEIIVMVLDTNRYYTAQVWNGSNAWGNELLCTGRSVNVAYEAMDVEYETSGNQGIIVNNSGIINNGRFNWCAWNGTNWSAQTTNQALHQDYMRFGRLVNDPNSDNLLLTYTDNDTDFGRLFWNGTSFGASYDLDTSVETIADRCFDGAFETIDGHAGHAVVAYGDGAVAVGRHATNPSSTTWDAGITICSDDTATVQIRRTGDGKIMAISFNRTDTQYEFSWYGTNWSAIWTLETAPSVIASPWKEPFMMAPQLRVLP